MVGRVVGMYLFGSSLGSNWKHSRSFDPVLHGGLYRFLVLVLLTYETRKAPIVVRV